MDFDWCAFLNGAIDSVCLAFVLIAQFIFASSGACNSSADRHLVVQQQDSNPELRSQQSRHEPEQLALVAARRLQPLRRDRHALATRRSQPGALKRPALEPLLAAQGLAHLDHREAPQEPQLQRYESRAAGGRLDPQKVGHRRVHRVQAGDRSLPAGVERLPARRVPENQQLELDRIAEPNAQRGGEQPGGTRQGVRKVPRQLHDQRHRRVEPDPRSHPGHDGRGGGRCGPAQGPLQLGVGGVQRGREAPHDGQRGGPHIDRDGRRIVGGRRDDEGRGIIVAAGGECGEVNGGRRFGLRVAAEHPGAPGHVDRFGGVPRQQGLFER